MSEALPPAGASIPQSRERFVALWGQMGSNWGIPRTMAEVHALLFIHGKPMNTDDVMDELDISRGNASMTLRNLVDWGIVQRVHRRGDRKEYFEAEQDVWKLFRTILRERKKREIDPLIHQLRECRAAATDAGGAEAGGAEERDEVAAAHNARLEELLSFLALVDLMCQQILQPGEGSDAAMEIAARFMESTA